jgi:hypothetical protein
VRWTERVYSVAHAPPSHDLLLLVGIAAGRPVRVQRGVFGISDQQAGTFINPLYKPRSS